MYIGENISHYEIEQHKIAEESTERMGTTRIAIREEYASTAFYYQYIIMVTNERMKYNYHIILR